VTAYQIRYFAITRKAIAMTVAVDTIVKISGTLNFINVPQLMLNLFSRKLSALESPPSEAFIC
jgi:hypothetical protein